MVVPGRRSTALEAVLHRMERLAVRILVAVHRMVVVHKAVHNSLVVVHSQQVVNHMLVADRILVVGHNLVGRKVVAECRLVVPLAWAWAIGNVGMGHTQLVVELVVLVVVLVALVALVQQVLWWWLGSPFSQF